MAQIQKKILILIFFLIVHLKIFRGSNLKKLLILDQEIKDLKIWKKFVS